MGSSESKREEKDELEFEADDEGLSTALRIHLSRLIAYAESADVTLQRQVAEKLANEAVRRECHPTLSRQQEHNSS